MRVFVENYLVVAGDHLEESMFAIQSLERVLYSAGRIKAARLKRSATKYRLRRHQAPFADMFWPSCSLAGDDGEMTSAGAWELDSNRVSSLGNILYS